MKILIHGINFAPELTGIGKYTGELAGFLVERGHAVRVITTPPYYPQWQVLPGYAAHRYQTVQEGNLRVTRCPLWVPKNPGGIKRLFHHLSFSLFSLPILMGQLAWKPDWMLSIAPSIMNAPFDLVFARMARAHSWLHVQDFEIDAAFDLGMIKKHSLVGFFAQRFEGIVFPKFDAVSTISIRMLDRTQEKGVLHEKAAYFPNWVDTDLIFPLERISPLRSALGIPDQQFVVLYSGNMGRKQGLEILVQAARLLKDAANEVLFILCGAGSMLAELQADCLDLPNVCFLPLQPLEKLNELLNLADLHVLPQSADIADLVLPSKLSGMLASGRPVVATAKEGTELYQIVSQVGLVVAPGDGLVLSQAIMMLARNRELRKKMANASRACAEMYFSKTRILEEFEATMLQKANSL
jgi:colanic acid biosynthesis glycosyl transferase WcaI